MSITAFPFVHVSLPRFGSAALAIKKRISKFVENTVTHSAGYKYSKKAHLLMSLSDEELTELDLPRDQTVQYVFHKQKLL